MRPVARLLSVSNGTPRGLKAAARWNLHTGLENRRTLIAFPGFESLVSRQDSYESPAMRGFCVSGVWEASFQAVSATPPDSRSTSRLHDLASAPVDRLRDALVNDDGSVTERWEQQEVELAGRVEFEPEEELAPF